MKKKFNDLLTEYITFLKNKKILSKKKIIDYEFQLEKLRDWKSKHNTNYLMRWFINEQKINKSKISIIHLNKLKKWKFNKTQGSIFHESGEFFKIIGVRVKNAKREVDEWDQPFIMQIGYKGGLIGLVRTYIKGVPHYLVEAKFEPGNYGKVQLSPSVQATYSNINTIHLGKKNIIKKKFFNKNFFTIRKYWVTEDGGRLYKKRNLHWIIHYTGKDIDLGKNKSYKWVTLWQINQMIKKKSFVSPHLRSILSLI